MNTTYRGYELRETAGGEVAVTHGGELIETAANIATAREDIDRWLDAR